jgi:uncharacterized protein
MPHFAFGGQDFQICGKTALFWPGRSALIVADLHLEKASWFAARGQMLPPYDSFATLERLAGLLAQTAPREVWCLGDNFHDVDGPDRLGEAASALLARLTTSCDWHWVTGNHDEILPAHIGGTVHDEAAVDGLILRHEARGGELLPELSGHFHPKVRARARGRVVSRPCFLRSETKLIFPAFGALTGGLDISHPAIRAASGGVGDALLEAGGRLISLPL